MDTATVVFYCSGCDGVGSGKRWTENLNGCDRLETTCWLAVLVDAGGTGR